MIRYTLRCGEGHRFESWFYDSSAFDEQVERRQVACPVCASVEVSKAIMAPTVMARGRQAEQAPAPSEAPSASPPLVSGEDRRRFLSALRTKVLAETRDVGRDFAVEARRIHDADASDERIRGQATLEEARDLLEDGIVVMPVPSAPEDLN